VVREDTRAKLPDRKPETQRRPAVDVPRWDFHWPQFCFFSSRVGLSTTAGQRLKVSCSWDNPTDREVRWGEGTSDEMCLAFVYVTGAL
jgi:hypothetical protein